MRKIEKIIIHCTATPEGRDVRPEEIKQWHLDRGWKDIGYHFVITLDGKLYCGRPIDQQGAHVRGHNEDSIGIVYVGGMSKDMKHSKDTRTREQKERLEEFLCYLKIMYPKSEIFGHNDFSIKDCPSFDARGEYKWISDKF